MNENPTWLKWAVELQALAQAGLHYTSNDFERERGLSLKRVGKRPRFPLTSNKN